ncbi:MAG: MarR family transcriptional regulator [Planctomycetota bacterium]|nr:MarR family transcriptional regulator [Planctomycetota bacterium]
MAPRAPANRRPRRARPAAPAPGDLADQIFEGLVRLAWGARQHDQALQRRFGVTAAQLSALRVLERHGEMPQSELSGRLFLRGSTVSGMLDRLEERELITRRRSTADRRLVAVDVGPGGRRLLQSIPRGQSKFGALRQLVRELPAAEARAFLSTLDKMVALLGADGSPRTARAERSAPREPKAREPRESRESRRTRP